jgi:hypothetical protein
MLAMMYRAEIKVGGVVRLDRAARARAGQHARAESSRRVVLTSTYEPGHRPLHVAAPAVALRRAGTRSAAWISACSRGIPAPSTGHRRSASRRPGLAARSDSVLVLFASADAGRRRARPPEPQRPGRVHGAGAGRLRNDPVGAAQWLGRWTGMVVRSGWAACPMLAVPAVVAFA